MAKLFIQIPKVHSDLKEFIKSLKDLGQMGSKRYKIFVMQEVIQYNMWPNY